MNKKEKGLNELRRNLEQEYGREVSWAEIEKIENFLRNMAKITVSGLLEDQRRQEMLKEAPGGFHLDKEGYSCSICGRPAFGQKSWFDEYGLKCAICQEAIKQREVPAWLGQRKDDWYSACQLEMFFCLRGTVLRQWIKKGMLHPRTIRDEKNRVHLQLFIIDENKNMLPPKDLLEGRMIKEVVEGREEYVFAPWYWFVDAKEHLKGYGIADYLMVARASNEG
jgi:hypothetical protein